MYRIAVGICYTFNKIKFRNTAFVFVLQIWFLLIYSEFICRFWKLHCHDANKVKQVEPVAKLILLSRYLREFTKHIVNKHVNEWIPKNKPLNWKKIYTQLETYSDKYPVQRTNSSRVKRYSKFVQNNNNKKQQQTNKKLKSAVQHVYLIKVLPNARQYLNHYLRQHRHFILMPALP